MESIVIQISYRPDINTNVTGTGCLIKLNFFVVASWQMREDDFGLLSCRLAVVSDD